MAAGAGDGESAATLSGGSTVVVGREGIFDHRCTQIHADKIRSSDASTVPDLICVHLCASVVETACFLVRTESAISAHVGRYASTYGPGDRMSVFERNRLGDLECNPCSGRSHPPGCLNGRTGCRCLNATESGPMTPWPPGTMAQRSSRSSTSSRVSRKRAAPAIWVRDSGAPPSTVT